MESDKHLTFLFIFILMVIACVIGETNNRALNQRTENDNKIKAVQTTEAEQQAAIQASELR